MIYGNVFLPKKEVSASVLEFGIESVAYNEYCNYKSLLEACTDESNRPILEAQVQILYEVSIKDIIEKVKEAWRKFKEWFKGILDKIFNINKKSQLLSDQIKVNKVNYINLNYLIPNGYKADVIKNINILYKDKSDKENEIKASSAKDVINELDRLMFNTQDINGLSSKLNNISKMISDNDEEMNEFEERLNIKNEFKDILNIKSISDTSVILEVPRPVMHNSNELVNLLKQYKSDLDLISKKESEYKNIIKAIEKIVEELDKTINEKLATKVYSSNNTEQKTITKYFIFLEISDNIKDIITVYYQVINRIFFNYKTYLRNYIGDLEMELDHISKYHTSKIKT